MKAKNTEYKPVNTSRRIIAIGTAFLASIYLPQAPGAEELIEIPYQLQETLQIQQSEVKEQLVNIRDDMIGQSINLNAENLSQEVTLKMEEIELANEEYYQQQEELKETVRSQSHSSGETLYTEKTLADNYSQRK